MTLTMTPNKNDVGRDVLTRNLCNVAAVSRLPNPTDAAP